MRKILALVIAVVLVALAVQSVQRVLSTRTSVGKTRIFQIQSIDTMKYSRDVAREKLHDPSYDLEIETEVKNIASTGATHVAVGTPYDAEFVPFLKRWVQSARKHKLNVWFRGNLAGWEEWFEYSKLSREEHTAGIVDFILSNRSLFENGDIFSSCPECENGGPGDPRQTGDVEEYRAFIINEYHAVSNAFVKIGKKVRTNTYSMNGDVAQLVMDWETTKALDSVVSIDHYVRAPETLVRDVVRIAGNSGGLVLLGEFGAPIPDIHGELSEGEQAEWINLSLQQLAKLPHVLGINYWTNKGSSTALWNEDNSPRQAVSTIRKYYNPLVFYGTIRDELGFTVTGVEVSTSFEKTVADTGKYRIFAVNGKQVNFRKKGYVSVNRTVSNVNGNLNELNVTMIPLHPSALYVFFTSLLNFMR